MTIPAVFVSHGSPTLYIDQNPTHDFLISLGTSLSDVQAMVCISAHWESSAAQISSSPTPPLIYDFWGFPPEMYSVRYAVPGDSALAARASGLLEAAGIPCALNPQRGLDHGAWVPVGLMFPLADRPILQLSLQTHLGARAALDAGRALQPLREEGVLIIGSGGAVHNLRELRSMDIDAPVPEYVKEFDAWLEHAAIAGDEAALLDFERQAPNPWRAHPTLEHFLPFFSALGAAPTGQPARKLHSAFHYGILSMACYAWD